MRLLDINTKQLELFYDVNERPKYAILSHTWGKEEVTIHDLQREDVEDMAGYIKIKYLCEQARRDGIKHVWIDTCCIDKSSSAELSEAINSMFKWYADADVCYAYLVDVQVSPGLESTPRYNDLPFQRTFGASRWFTRGWTLQELLAPEHVFFYDKDWKKLGSKAELSEIIAAITRINEQALTRPWSLPTFSIAARMSWASARNTTREEDLAYCLLGLFGINIPLLYGEGSRAFRRLQEELTRTDTDESLFVHNGHNMLADQPSDFSRSGSIVPVEGSWRPQPFTTTSVGLHVQISLLQDHNPGEWRAILNCHEQDDYSSYLSIPLKELRPGYFSKRWKYVGSKSVSAEEVEISETHSIYIVKQETIESYTFIISADLLEECGYVLTSVAFATPWPEREKAWLGTWHPSGRILRIKANPNPEGEGYFYDKMSACLLFSHKCVDHAVTVMIACDRNGNGPFIEIAPYLPSCGIEQSVETTSNDTAYRLLKRWGERDSYLARTQDSFIQPISVVNNSALDFELEVALSLVKDVMLGGEIRRIVIQPMASRGSVECSLEEAAEIMTSCELLPLKIPPSIKISFHQG